MSASQLGLAGESWSAIGNSNDDLANLGFVVVGIFALCWIASTVIYRWQRFNRLEIRNPASGLDSSRVSLA